MEKIGEGVEHLLHELSVLTLSGHEVHAGEFVLTNYMFFLLIALVVTFLFFMIGVRKVSLVPESRLGGAIETGVEFVRDSLCIETMGPEGRKYVPFVGTIFFFVLFNNLIGLIPGSKPGTGTMGTTVTWAVVVFIVYNAIGIKRHGVWGYAKSFWPKGVPGPIAAVVALLEVVSHLVRPLTLSVRLYANMYAGHVVLGIFSILGALLLEASGVMKVIAVLPVMLQIVLYALEVFVAVIQAYIFAILTSVYIGGAIHTH
ncbi:MAG: F0F1 ATP synthase subunit A [Anaerosomatales bacterium]|nr:F0F1 ATP synthase subunit A [Anaerosomatales bacterium]